MEGRGAGLSECEEARRGRRKEGRETGGLDRGVAEEVGGVEEDGLGGRF